MSALYAIGVISIYARKYLASRVGRQGRHGCNRYALCRPTTLVWEVA